MSSRPRRGDTTTNKVLFLCKGTNSAIVKFIEKATKHVQDMRVKAQEEMFSDKLTEDFMQKICSNLLESINENSDTIQQAVELLEFVWSNTAKFELGEEIAEREGQRFGDRRADDDNDNQVEDHTNFQANLMAKLEQAMQEEIDPKKHPTYQQDLKKFGITAQKAMCWANKLASKEEYVLKQRHRIDDKKYALMDDKVYREWSRHTNGLEKIITSFNLLEGRIGNGIFWNFFRSNKAKRQLVLEDNINTLADVANAARQERTKTIAAKEATMVCHKRQLVKRPILADVANAERQKRTKTIAAKEATRVFHKARKTGVLADVVNRKTKTIAEKETPRVPKPQKITASAETKTTNPKALAETPGGESVEPGRKQVTPEADMTSSTSTKIEAEAVKSEKMPRKGKQKTVRDLEHGAFYFKCPAPECPKVSTWSNIEEDKELALEQGMVLLPEDPETKCRQIDNRVAQHITCLKRPGYVNMKSHMAKCPHWQAIVKEKLSALPPQKDCSAPTDIDTNAPLYRDRRYRLKKDGSHNLSTKQKRELQRERDRQKRKLTNVMLEVVKSNWDSFGPMFEKCGLEKKDIPAEGEGFAVPVSYERLLSRKENKHTLKEEEDEEEGLL